MADRGVLLLLVKNPAGANEALRTLEDGGVPPTLVVALNDRIADGRDVSWIWDVDFEPVLQRVERIVARRARRRARPAVHLRRASATPPRARPGPRDGARQGAPAHTRGWGAVILPTYTAMLELRAIATGRGLTRPYWESDGQP